MENIIDIPEPEPFHVYVQTDEQGHITAVNSSAFVSAGWGTEIDQGYGDQYHHAQGNYFPQPIYTDDGIPRYKLVDGSPVERTEEEIAADWAALPMSGPPTITERDLPLSGVSGTTKYGRDSSGYTHIRGRIAGAAESSVFATLPEGYRPAVTVAKLITQATDGADIGAARLEISAAGELRVTSTTNATALSDWLDISCSFPVGG